MDDTGVQAYEAGLQEGRDEPDDEAIPPVEGPEFDVPAEQVLAENIPLTDPRVQKAFDLSAVQQALAGVRQELAIFKARWRLAVRGCGPKLPDGQKQHPKQIAEEVRRAQSQIDILVGLLEEAENSEEGIAGPSGIEIPDTETVTKLTAKRSK